ncbi:TonB-dependent receptor [Ectothiorhodospiraceae bacterium WFHF3C12]|nr:TonB-dependent receptor [Ectothiorhodospiraceae bacterium WFHF3C12]
MFETKPGVTWRPGGRPGPVWLLGLALAAGGVQAQEGDSGTLQLDAVSVIGEDPGELLGATGSAHSVDEESLERYEYDDIHRVLNEVPGVYIRGEDGYGLRPNIGLRGTTTERSQKITLMEDQVLIGPAPYAAPAAYYFPMVSRMVEVEVVKGPAAVAHGPATVGGALNLITRRVPFETEVGVDAALGTDAYRKLHAHYGDSTDQLGWLIEGLHTQTRGFKDLDGGGDTGFDKNNLMVKTRWNSGMEAALYQEVELKLGYADETSNETYTGLTDDDFDDTPYRRYAGTRKDEMDWEHTQVQLRHFVEFTPALTLRTNIYRHDFERAWAKLNGFDTDRSLLEILSNPDAGLNRSYMEVLRGERDSQISQETLLVGTNDREYYSQGVQSVLEWFPRWGWSDHHVSLGLRFHQDQVRRDHTEDGYLMRDGRMVPDGGDTRQTTLNRESADAFSAYLLDEMRYRRWTVNAGVRLEQVDYTSEDDLTGTRRSNSDSAVLPGAGVFYQVAPSWGVLAGVHKGFVPTGPGESDDVEPEESVNYEAGARYLDDSSRAELIGFYNDYSNLKGTCTISSGCPDARGQTFNGGEVDVYGIEALMAHEVRLTERYRVPLHLSYTYTETEFQTSFESSFALWGEVEAGDRLPYMPRHQATARAGLATADWDVTASAHYVGEQLEQAGDGEADDGDDDGPLAGATVDAYTVVDLAGRYRIDRQFTTYLTVENVFDKEYMISRRPYGARPGKPRTFVAGLKYDF